MRKIALLLAAAGIGLSGAASAADMAPVYKKAPVVAPMWSWSGSYIGGYVGGADGRRVDTASTVGGVFSTANYDLGSSFIGGYTSGYNWQFAPNWLLGYEGESGYLKVKGAGILDIGRSNTGATAEIGSWYSVWAARLGYVADKSLLYVKGGAVYTRLDSGVNIIPPGTPAGVMSGHKYAFGYAVGGGWEYAFDPKWSVKAEYLYLGLDKDVSFTNVAGTAAATTHFNGVHTGKVGLNYKWDWFGMFR